MKSDNLIFMSKRRVTATEFARNLSSHLSQVRYGSVELEVWRGKQPVARVLPPVALPGATPAPGFPIEQLNALFSNLPRLGADEAARFASDLESLDRTVGAARDPWGS